MKTTRQLILEFIRSHRAVTARDLSRAFNTSPANARHHLRILHEQGLVVAGKPKPSFGKGRPGRLFWPARLVTGDNLEMLAGVLLELLSLCEDDPGGKASIERLVELMRGRMSGPGEPTAGNLTQKLNRITLLLNRFHYSSRWEAHVGHPRLILGNCPYASLVPKHPELCIMDLGIISRSLGAPAVQAAKLENDSTGLPYCQFLIGKEKV